MKAMTAVLRQETLDLRRFAAWMAALVAAAVFATGSPDVRAGDRKTSGGRIDARVMYHNYCSVCHGDSGDGRSRARSSLIPPPADFTDARLRGKLTREYMGAIVKAGKPGTAMAGYSTQLNDGEVAAVVDYVRTAFVDRAGNASPRPGDGRDISGISAHGGRERDAPGAPAAPGAR